MSALRGERGRERDGEEPVTTPSRLVTGLSLRPSHGHWFAFPLLRLGFMAVKIVLGCLTTLPGRCIKVDGSTVTPVVLVCVGVGVCVCACVWVWIWV